MARIQFTSPVGRMVLGSFFDLQKTDHENKALPENRYHWFTGIAIPKTQAKWWDEPHPMFQAIRQAAEQIYTPDVWQSPYFSSKVEDGDGKNKDRQGYAGCWIVKFTRNLFMGANRVEAPRLGDTAYNPIIDPMMAKKGYYYAVSGDCEPNGKQGAQAGVFVNFNMGILVAQGEEIVVGPSLAQAFAGVKFDVPVAGTVTPAPQAAAASPSPAPAPEPQAAAGPATPRMTPVSDLAKANPDPDSAYWTASGWTHDLLVQNGHFTRAL